MLSLLLFAFLAGGPSTFPNGLYCAQSYYAFGDIVPGTTESSYIVDISRILSGSVTVGFLYSLNNGERVAQGLPAMSKADRAVAGIRLKAGDALSNLAPIRRNPWRELKIVRCSTRDYHHKLDRGVYISQ